MKNVIKTSVRGLVEFVLRSGDLVNTFTGSSRNTDAIRAHQKIQKSSPKEYTPEVTLNYTVEDEDMILEINGRADGIIDNKDGIVIDEIKTTTAPLEFVDENYNELHWAQAKCYGYIYCKKNELNKIGVQLTYYQMDTKEIKRFLKNYTLGELEQFFNFVVEEYLVWAKKLKNSYIKRDKSIEKLQFPFKEYREGQRKLAVSVYRNVEEGKGMFIQAPTGIGKTIGTLFPSIKAIREGHITKIFYLTAKTITRTVAEESLQKMRKQGLKIKSVTLTAKDKICFKEERICDPEKCEFSKGYFDRLNGARDEIFQEDNFSRGVIEKYAEKHKICPFEFSLELTNYVDCIICDYNYVFDPKVYLRGFLSEGNVESAFLIDEAHNLVDRAREMFSATINKKEILELKKICKKDSPDISKKLNKINSAMISFRKKCEENNNQYVKSDKPEELGNLLREFVYHTERWLIENKNNEVEFKDRLLELYFNALSFIRVYDEYDERYITYAEKVYDDVNVKLFCLDPSKLLKEAMKRGKAFVAFSATLTPMNYFIDILGGDENSYRLKLKSPFKSENLCLLVDNKVSTKYNRREFTYLNIVEDVEEIIKGKIGNYIVFFPSYKYMNEVYSLFCDKNPKVNVICQKIGMSEEEKEEFLQTFSKEAEEGIVGFAVMGGIFSEGIDLTGEKLIGTIIVGVGLPQICLERNIISEYFNNKNNRGFEYAYIYPGMNKVMQAAGRVIRTEKDKGVVLLIDERFTYSSYKGLFPKEWEHYIICKNKVHVSKSLSEFWRKNK